jgi:two-component system phosphate regulon sensor histidine kinase PhoR
MSWNFYRRLTVALLVIATLLSLVLVIFAALLYGGRFTLFMALMTLLISLILFVVALGIRRNDRFNRELTAAMGKMASGQLGNRIPVREPDTPGKIAQAFNEMTVNLFLMVTRLSEDRSRLQTILNTINDGVIMTDHNGDVVMSNPAAERLFDFKRERSSLRPLIELVHEHEIDDLLKRCLKEEKQQSMQFESRASRQFFRIVANPLITGRLTGVLLLFQDLTEVRYLQSVRKEFIANISHELKTPLASIKAIVETLQDGAVDEKAVARDFLGKINGEVDALIQMVSELLELSRIEIGQAELKIEPVNLNAMVRDTINRLSPQAERGQITVTTEPAMGLAPVPADRQMIGEVLTNILDNAIKFTPPGGNVKIRTGIDANMAVVSVADTGIGIGTEDLPHIFERFYKADKSRNSGGTGLGLSIARHIIQAHGGRIWVESEAGTGATFTFALPFSPGTPNRASTQ